MARSATKMGLDECLWHKIPTKPPQKRENRAKSDKKLIISQNCGMMIDTQYIMRLKCFVIGSFGYDKAPIQKNFRHRRARLERLDYPTALRACAQGHIREGSHVA